MRRRPGLLMFVTAAALAATVGLRAQSERPVATTIEQALIEYACSKPASLALDPEKHDECLHTKLDALRADFGRNLSRLPAGERRTIDSACAPVRDSQGREGYLACLSGRLNAIRDRRARADDPAPAAPVAQAAGPAPVVTSAPPASGATAMSSRTWLAVTLVAVVLAAGAVAVVIRSRRSRRVCHACGTRVQGGDLCAACRHEAAETLRRAAADRQRAQDEEERHQRERDEGGRRRAREAEDARQRDQDAARLRDEAAQRLEEEEKRREAQAAARASEVTAAASEAVFDPHAILGVAPGAGLDAIRAAYEQAKAKYDPELVSGLGVEIQNHYLAKAQAVDRAFAILSQPQPRSSS